LILLQCVVFKSLLMSIYLFHLCTVSKNIHQTFFISGSPIILAYLQN